MDTRGCISRTSEYLPAMRLSTEAPLRGGPLPPPSPGSASVLLARLLTLPRSLWEMDEVLFVKGRRAVRSPDPPAPPAGLPAGRGPGQAAQSALPRSVHQPGGLSVISSLVGYWALVAAFRRIARRGPDAEAGGGRRSAPLPALAGDARLGPSADVGPAGADVPLPGPGRRSAPAGGRRALERPGAGGRRLGRDRLPAAARPGRPPHAGRGALADAGVAPAAARSWPPSPLVSLLWFVPLVLATVGGPAGFSRLLSQAGRPSGGARRELSRPAAAPL